MRWARRPLRKARRLAEDLSVRFPRIRECNVCGWQGRRFESDFWHPHTVCPRCRSEVRHRLLIAALSHEADLSYARLIEGRSVLHFAPEAKIQDALRRSAGRYVTADLYRRDVDLTVDISDMASIESCTFDVTVACDVLEHVDDDRKAMRELFRVLTVGGCAILTVPQKDGLKATLEDKTIVDPEERKRVFGQRDHLRIYGDNFPAILESEGFEVTTINERNFPEAMVKRHVLFPPVLSRKPLATNHRRVFFAQKTDLVAGC